MKQRENGGLIASTSTWTWMVFAIGAAQIAGELGMPTNPTLPTPAEILKRVKAREWGHEFPDDAYAPCPCRRCGEDISNETNFCPPQIAQAIQAAMVEDRRRTAQWLRIARGRPSEALALEEAADALEKGER